MFYKEKKVLGNPLSVNKPWGNEIWFANNIHYMGKILNINAGHRLSLQKHLEKHESLYMISGLAKLFYNDNWYDWFPGYAISIPPGTVHRFEAIENTVLVEVSTCHPEDVIRLEDDYNREVTNV